MFNKSGHGGRGHKTQPIWKNTGVFGAEAPKPKHTSGGGARGSHKNKNSGGLYGSNRQDNRGHGGGGGNIWEA